MKYIFTILFLFLLLPVCQGGLSDTGEGIIAGGIEKAMVNIGDDCFSMGMELQGVDNSVSGNISTAVFHMSTLTLNPFDFPPVIEVQKKMALLYLFIAVILIFVYGTQAIVAYYRPSVMQSVNYITGQSQAAPLPELVYKISGIFGVMLFIDFLLLVVLGINYVYTSLIMIDVINHICVAPDNPFFYLCFGAMYLTMNIFYAYRGLVICIIAAYGLIIGALYLIECTRWVAVCVFGYFTVMVFMQSIVTSICAVVIPIIEQGIALVPGMFIGPGTAVYIVSYFVLLIIIFLVGLACVFSPIIIAIAHFLFRRALYNMF